MKEEDKCYMCMYWHQDPHDNYYGECGENGHRSRFSDSCGHTTREEEEDES